MGSRVVVKRSLARRSAKWRTLELLPIHSGAQRKRSVFHGVCTPVGATTSCMCCSVLQCVAVC